MLDVGAAHPLPSAVIYFAETVPLHQLEPVRLGDDGGGVDRPLHRTAVRRRDRIVLEAPREPFGLQAAVRPEWHIGGPRESILGSQCSLAVSDEEQSCRHAAGYRVALPAGAGGNCLNSFATASLIVKLLEVVN